ncbi:hypothetical protein R5M92_05965 [Halomonas sp. Bachu 37]|uniref:ATP-binding protein n=1 Tax=Halomonas kashgarensis TaxID=3084920 RepID=UPI003216B244
MEHHTDHEDSPDVLIAACGIAARRWQQACDELGLIHKAVDPASSIADAWHAELRKQEDNPSILILPGARDTASQLALVRECERYGLSVAAPRAVLLEAMLDGSALRQLVREIGVPLAAPGSANLAVAVIADAQGHAMALFDYQPTLLENDAVQSYCLGSWLAPSPLLTPEQRRYLWQLAVTCVTELDVRSAVTVHFSVSGNRMGFVVMTGGLGLEVALGEALTGLDLVIEQIQAARGRPLEIAPRHLRSSLVARTHRISLPWAPEGLDGGPGIRWDAPPNCHEGLLTLTAVSLKALERRQRRALTCLQHKATRKA